MAEEDDKTPKDETPQDETEAQPEAEAPAEPAAEEAAPEAPAEAEAETPAEERPDADAAAEPAAEEGGGAAPAAAAPASDDEEGQPTPKQQRKRERSRFTGDARPQRSSQDRADERAQTRSRKAQSRSRWRRARREKVRSKRGAGGEAQPAPVSRARGERKVRQGVVVSSKADKTITVRIDLVRAHRVYGKVVRNSGTLRAHDESNQANEGDVVRVIECRPLSRTKRWRLLDVLEKAR
jgi:small subunit ribosomal protein S17